jgi:hypothetical protein
MKGSDIVNVVKPTLNQLKKPSVQALRKAKPSNAINMLLNSYIKEVDQEDDYLRAILLGELGTGKTCVAATCRFPVLLDSFDPGGTTSVLLRPYIQDHRILRMTIFEKERPETPQAFDKYTTHFARLLSSGIFDKIGTYFPDSLTTLGDSIMYKVLAARGASPTEQPEQRDYLHQQLYLINVVKQWTTLPCDVVTTGHLIPEKNKEGAVIAYNMMMTGKLVTKIPLLFNEIYAMRVRRDKDGPHYEFRTVSDTHYKVRTRMGAGVFSQFEPADIKQLLKKAGRNCEDLPLLQLETEVKDGEVSAGNTPEGGGTQGAVS